MNFDFQNLSNENVNTGRGIYFISGNVMHWFIIIIISDGTIQP